MCVAVDGRQTIPHRWLSLLVIRIRTSSWGGMKRHEGSKSHENQAYLSIPISFICK